MASSERTLSVRLDLEIGRDPIAGRLVRNDGTQREFVGWLALVRALDEATKRDRQKGASEHHTPPSA